MIIKERKLAVGLRMLQIPQGAFFILGQLPGDKVLFNRSTVPLFPWQVIKYWARFRTTPIVFSEEKSSRPQRLA